MYNQSCLYTSVQKNRMPGTAERSAAVCRGVQKEQGSVQIQKGVLDHG